MNSLKRHAGFTLIELMIAVAVVGVLAGIAYPSYKEYVMKSRRSDAKTGLLALQMAQDKFRTNCIQYATTMSTNSADYDCDSATSTFKAVVDSTSSPDGYYTLSIVAADDDSYSLKATRLSTGAQNGDKCGDFQIDENGNKSVVNAASGYDAARCW